jgi:hypothetical protein
MELIATEQIFGVLVVTLTGSPDDELGVITKLGRTSAKEG